MIKQNKLLNLKEDAKIITCHIGNGGSLAAVKNGKCIDTSMGFTPNAGIIMGSRSGDIDARIIKVLKYIRKVKVILPIMKWK